MEDKLENCDITLILVGPYEPVIGTVNEIGTKVLASVSPNGIDSSYLLYIMVEKYGLRPLVFHVDAGWNSQIAVNNIERLVDGLGLDLYTEVINWEEMKDLQLAFFKSGVPHIDTPQDHSFFATMYKFASKHNIKYILLQ